MDRDTALSINVRPISRAYAATRTSGNPAQQFDSTFTAAITGGALWTWLMPDGRALVIQMTPRRVLGDLQRALGFVRPDFRFGPQTASAVNTSLGLPIGTPIGRRTIERMLLALYHVGRGDVLLPPGNVSIYDPNAVPIREVTGGDTTLVSRLEFRDGGFQTPTTVTPDVQPVPTGALVLPGSAARSTSSTATNTSTSSTSGTAPGATTPGTTGGTTGGTQSNFTGTQSGTGEVQDGTSSTTNTTNIYNTLFLGQGGAGGQGSVTPVGSQFIPAGARTLASGVSLSGAPFIVYQTVAGLIYLLSLAIGGVSITGQVQISGDATLPNGTSLPTAQNLDMKPPGAATAWPTMPQDEKCAFYTVHANDPGITVPAPCLAQTGIAPQGKSPYDQSRPAVSAVGLGVDAVSDATPDAIAAVAFGGLVAALVGWAIDQRLSRNDRE